MDYNFSNLFNGTSEDVEKIIEFKNQNFKAFAFSNDGNDLIELEFSYVDYFGERCFQTMKFFPREQWNFGDNIIGSEQMFNKVKITQSTPSNYRFMTLRGE